jgi:hypothetical protein
VTYPRDFPMYVHPDEYKRIAKALDERVSAAGE